MNVEMTGDLLSVSGTKAWKGSELTNGFLMRNADGRVAAITQSGTLDLTANSAVQQAVPFGNGLIRLLSDSGVDSINALRSGVLADSLYKFAGIVKYEPGWAISHPVQNWGIPAFSKFTSITRGMVGFKFSQKAGQSDADYLAFIKGDKSKVTAIDTFDDWMTALAAATVIGSALYLMMSITTGFPRVMVGVADRTAVTVPVGYVLVAEAVIFEPENAMLGFELDGKEVYGAAGVAPDTAFNITYDANGADSGTVPVDATDYVLGDEATIAGNTGTLVLATKTFSGWNTLANGNGVTYPAATTFYIGEDTTLYALWL